MKIEYIYNTEVCDPIVGQPSLIVMRGLPGSGKSTMAEMFVDSKHGNATIISADHYFIDKYSEEYRFQAWKLPMAHAECFARFHELSYRPFPANKDWNIILDNTNTQWWEMKNYIALAIARGYSIQIAVAPLMHRTPSQLAQSCIHGVPEVAIAQMENNWEESHHLTPKIQSLVWEFNGNKGEPEPTPEEIDRTDKAEREYWAQQEEPPCPPPEEIDDEDGMHRKLEDIGPDELSDWLELHRPDLLGEHIDE